MRREHAKHSGALTRYALTQGFSQSVTRDDGTTVTLSRKGGRGTEFLVTVTDKNDTRQFEFKELSQAREMFGYQVKAEWKRDNE